MVVFSWFDNLMKKIFAILMIVVFLIPVISLENFDFSDDQLTQDQDLEKVVPEPENHDSVDDNENITSENNSKEIDLDDANTIDSTNNPVTNNPVENFAPRNAITSRPTELQEILGRRTQNSRHFFNASSTTLTYQSDQLVYYENLSHETQWTTFDEYPITFIIRLTNGSNYKLQDVADIETLFSQITNTSLWGLGVETYSGLLGFYTNFADTEWGHGQYLYYPRLKNGRLSNFTNPLYAIYPRLSVRAGGSWFDTLLNNRSFYSGTNDPRDHLNFFNQSDEIGLFYQTDNVDIDGFEWNITQGFKYNTTDRQFHMITRINSLDRGWQNVGFGYEITTSPQATGTPYEPERFLLQNSTHEKLINITTLWRANETITNPLNKIIILSENNEAFTFNFDDMQQAGFNKTYLELHNSILPNGISKKTLLAGMYNYGTYTQNTLIEIDPTFSAKQSTDEYDFDTTTNFVSSWGVRTGSSDMDVGYATAFANFGYITFDTGITQRINAIGNITLTFFQRSTTIEVDEYVAIELYYNSSLYGGFWNETYASSTSDTEEWTIMDSSAYFNHSEFWNPQGISENKTMNTTIVNDLMSNWTAHHNIDPANRQFIPLILKNGTGVDFGENDKVEIDEAETGDSTKLPTLTFDYELSFYPLVIESATGEGISVTEVESSSITGVERDLYIANVATKPYKDTTLVFGLNQTWTELLLACSDDNDTSLAIWWVLANSSITTGTVNATVATAPSSIIIQVFRITNVNITNTISLLGYNNTNNGLCNDSVIDNDFPNVEINQIHNSSLLLGVISRRADQISTVYGEWSILGEVEGTQGSGQDAGISTIQATPNATGLIEANATLIGTTDWIIAGVEILVDGATIDLTIPNITIITGNQTIAFGDTGNEAQWQLWDENPANFSIYRNGTGIANGTYTNGQLINQSLDGLALGLWNFTLFANDTNGNSNTSTVWVTVSEIFPPELDSPPDQTLESGFIEGGELSSTHDFIESDTTTSSTWEDVDELTTTITTTDTSNIVLFASIQAMGSVSAEGGWRLVFDSVNYLQSSRNIGTLAGNILITDMVEAKAAGTYVFKLQHRVSTGTLTTHNVELVAFSLHNTFGSVPSNSSYVSTDTVGSSWSDISGLSNEITLSSTSHIFSLMVIHGSHSVDDKDVSFALNIDSTRMEVHDRDFVTSNTNGSISVITRTDTPKAAGTYTVKGEWRGEAGSTFTGYDIKLITIAAEANNGLHVLDIQKQVVASDTTTSTTLEDIDGLTVEAYHFNPAHVFSIMSISANVSVVNSTSSTTMSVDGVDSHVMERGHASTTSSASIGQIARTHTKTTANSTIKGRWFTDSGNTVQGNNMVLISIGLFAGIFESKNITWIPTERTNGTDQYIVYLNGSIFDSGSWTNQTPIVILLDSINSTIGLHNFTIRINDTINADPIDLVWITIQDTTIPILNDPANQTFLFGTPNRWINWTAIGAIPANYSIFRNGTIVANGMWLSVIPINYSLTGLGIGFWNFTIVVNNTNTFEDSDDVWITVLTVIIPDITRIIIWENLTSPFDFVASNSSDGFLATIFYSNDQNMNTTLMISVFVTNGSFDLLTGNTSLEWNDGINITITPTGTYVFNFTYYIAQTETANNINISIFDINGNSNSTLINVQLDNDAPTAFNATFPITSTSSCNFIVEIEQDISDALSGLYEIWLTLTDDTTTTIFTTLTFGLNFLCHETNGVFLGNVTAYDNVGNAREATNNDELFIQIVPSVSVPPDLKTERINYMVDDPMNDLGILGTLILPLFASVFGIVLMIIFIKRILDG